MTTNRDELLARMAEALRVMLDNHNGRVIGMTQYQLHVLAHEILTEYDALPQRPEPKGEIPEGAAVELCPKCGRMLPRRHNCFDDPYSPPASAVAEPYCESCAKCGRWRADILPQSPAQAATVSDAMVEASLEIYRVQRLGHVRPSRKTARLMIEAALALASSPAAPAPVIPEGRITRTRK